MKQQQPRIMREDVTTIFRIQLSATSMPSDGYHGKRDRTLRARLEVACAFFGVNGAYEMDTGHIDSHTALGVNAPRNERLTYRKLTTCSPIHTTGHVNKVKETDVGNASFGDTILEIYFGSISGPGVNYTFRYNEYSRVENFGYSLQ